MLQCQFKRPGFFSSLLVGAMSSCPFTVSACSREGLVCRHETGERDKRGGNFVTGLPRNTAAAAAKRVHAADSLVSRGRLWREG